MPALSKAVHSCVSVSRCVLRYLVKYIDVLLVKLVEIIPLAIFSITVSLMVRETDCKN